MLTPQRFALARAARDTPRRWSISNRAPSGLAAGLRDCSAGTSHRFEQPRVESRNLQHHRWFSRRAVCTASRRRHLMRAESIAGPLKKTGNSSRVEFVLQHNGESL